MSTDHSLVPNPSPSHRLAYMLLLSKVLQLQLFGQTLGLAFPPSNRSWTTWTTSKEKTQGLGFTVDQSINTNHASRTQEPRRPRWVSMRVGRLGDSLDSIHNRCSTKNTKKRLLVLGVAHFILAFPKSFHPWHTPSTSVYLVNASRRLGYQQH